MFYPMFPRLAIALFALGTVAFCQSLPSYQLIQEVDASGMDSVAGLGTDSQGNVYIAGTTSSAHFPVKNAYQPAIASAGLYRINGAAFTALGLSSCWALAVDPQNPSVIYAVSNGALLKSVNSGVSFAPTTLPSSLARSIAIQPGNDQILFAGTTDQGVLKSADGGGTWTALNNGIPVQYGGQISVLQIWIDPSNVSVIFAQTPSGLLRSGDGAASWQLTTVPGGAVLISFDTTDAGRLYVSTSGLGVLTSTDDGLTFAQLTVARGIDYVYADPIQPGRLIGAGGELYQSTDSGVTWTLESAMPVFDLVADTANGVYYAAVSGSGLVRISANLQTLTSVGPQTPPYNLSALAVVNGQLYEANTGSADVFVTKLDPAGNVLYSTYLGGTGDDQAAAMTVDAAGNVFVTGITGSADFPVSNGAYATAGSVFLSRLNPDGSLGYSTYFTETTPVAVATDGNGSAWILGNNENGGLPVTPGALAGTFCCTPPFNGFGPPIIPEEATLTRFSPSGSSLTFSTYVPGSGVSDAFGLPAGAAGALAIAPDGSAYVGGFTGFVRIDPTGSTLLASLTTNAPLSVTAMALGPDGSVYIAGTPQKLQPTPGAFRDDASEAGIVRMDPTLKTILAATYFGTYAQVRVMTTDASGNLYLGGLTAPLQLQTRTPFSGGFANPTGFMSELSGDLSALLFSSYFGDTENFTVSGVGLGMNGSVWIGGATNQCFCSPPSGPGNVWVNGLALTPPPALRIDNVENAASFIDGPLAAGETIVVNGAGFSSNAELMIGGAVVAPVSITPSTITATVPASVPSAGAAIAVQSGGASTNQVLMPVAVNSPGIFSQNGAGYGQGYILNQDATLNTPTNPAAPGEQITVFATGVGPMTFTQCCAVTDSPVNVYINGIYCDGVLAIIGPVNGLPGSVYQITVYVPNPAVLFPNLNPPFVFPPLDRIYLQVNGASSQANITISIAQ